MVVRLRQRKRLVCRRNELFDKFVQLRSVLEKGKFFFCIPPSDNVRVIPLRNENVRLANHRVSFSVIRQFEFRNLIDKYGKLLAILKVPFVESKVISYFQKPTRFPRSYI